MQATRILILTMLCMLSACATKSFPIFASPEQEKIFAREFSDRLSAILNVGRPILVGRPAHVPQRYHEWLDRYISYMNIHTVNRTRSPDVLIDINEMYASTGGIYRKYTITVLILDGRQLIYPGRALLMTNSGEAECTTVISAPGNQCDGLLLSLTARTALMQM